MMSCIVLPQFIPFREKPEELREVHGHAKAPGAFEPNREAGDCLLPKQNVGRVRVHEKRTGQEDLAAGLDLRIDYLMAIIRQAGGLSCSLRAFVSRSQLAQQLQHSKMRQLRKRGAR
jgi:hypothetical protein